MPVRDHTEFDVWILACEIRQRVVAILRIPALRDRELLWLRVQLRKAANSACTNAAEGYARYYPKEFARFLGISKSSLAEIKSHLLEPEVLECVGLPFDTLRSHLRPRILQRHRPVEHGCARHRVLVHDEVAKTLELEA